MLDTSTPPLTAYTKGTRAMAIHKYTPKQESFDIIAKIWLDPEIRWVELNGNYYLSIVDGVRKYALITDKATGETRRRTEREAAVYWSTSLRRTLEEEGFQLWDAILQLPLPSHKDGKKYKTDCADPATFLRIIDSIRDPSLEPHRMAIARVLGQTLAITMYQFREITEGRGWAAEQIHHEMKPLPPPDPESPDEEIGYNR